MYAIVESNTVTKVITNPKALTIGDVQYPSKIFSLWSEAELKAIGIYIVEFNHTNKKDESYYNNTNETIAYDSSADKVTSSFGSATAKAISDSLWTQQDSDDGLLPSNKSVGDLKTEGLKTIKKRIINDQASGILAQTDWYVTKATEVTSYTVPSSVTTHRTNVRAKCNEMQTAIDGCANVEALITLYAYVNTGTEENPVMTRPLGEFPTLEL